ncbi:Pex12 amino terminal region-domain-containing protein [Phycomyces blakesleeanus]|uniref:Peroxisome assembly protein 12 n=1 Tax=Phycomyces blakesleeanus TaxID=4837 RepID=A0ABR3BH19_PHYBL
MEFMSALGSGEDAFRPSLFEIVAQEKLRELLQPAVQYLLAIYAQRYPRLLIRVVNNHEEFYSVLMFFIERHYLKEWGASFAENFYGLKRVSSAHLASRPKFSSVGPETTPPLSSKEIQRSLLILVGLPYIKCRLDLFYQRISGGPSASLLGDNEQEEREREQLADSTTPFARILVIRLTRLFRKVYPYINALYYGSNLVYNIGYMFGKTDYYSPWFHLIGLQVKRMSMSDYVSYNKMITHKRVYRDPTSGQAKAPFSLFKKPWKAFPMVFGKLIEFLKVLLPMSIFFFKFLEWWYSSEFARGGGVQEESKATIPPPKNTKPDPRGVPLPSTPNTCPVCLSQPIPNPTALPSGYVFCYTCAYHYVEEHNRCPVTWQRTPQGVQDLTKVYADNL